MVWGLPRIKVYLSGVDVDPASALYMILNVVDRIFYEYGVRLEVESVEPRPPWEAAWGGPTGFSGYDAGSVDDGQDLDVMTSYMVFGDRVITLSRIGEDEMFYEITSVLAEVLGSADRMADAAGVGVWGKNPPRHLSSPVYLLDEEGELAVAA